VRIHVTGNAGAGKTTLARELGKLLRSPVIHLDRIVWQSGWTKVPMAEKEELLRRISEPPNWLIEGVSGIIRQRADFVVFLDTPRRVCLLRCMKRNWRYLFRSRPELPDDCPEYLILPSLLKMIWQFPRLVGARIHTEARQSNRYVVIRSQSDLETWLKEFAPSHAAEQAHAAAADG
jgi:adenylate kinase family enzyme